MPTGAPSVERPHVVDRGDLRLTWIGHASFLVQLPGLNLLTDPILSRRASPVSWLGPARFSPPGLTLEALPPIDVVLLSHDHYDHLDRPTVDRLHARFGERVIWVTPLGYRGWLRGRGIRRVVEADWWQEVRLEGVAGSSRSHRIVCLPIRHWTRRGWATHRRLWASWAVLPVGAEHVDVGGSAGLYFAGDSGWFDGFAEIGRRLGPFRASLIPIGAYEPRWFMATSHMTPEEAVRAYGALGGRGAFVGMHWGTFRLTDEDPLEPPRRTREAWREAGFPERDLKLPGIGGTVRPGGG